MAATDNFNFWWAQKLSRKLFKFYYHIPHDMEICKWFLARLLILIKKGGLLQLKFGVVGVGVNIYLWAR